MSKKSFIDSIKVKSPCSEDWNEMRGNAQVRFCSHCNLNVNNLSAMTRKEALKLVRKSEGRICVQYIQNPIDKKPIFGDKLYQITRRAGIAAGVLSASLTLSTLSYAQDSTESLPNNAETQTELVLDNAETDETESPTAVVSGTVTDSNGAFAANVSVYLFDLATDESREEKTDSDGFYEFKNVRQGNYKIVINDDKGSAEVGLPEISESGENRRDLALTMTTLAEVTVESLPQSVETITSGGMIAVSVSYENPLSTAVSQEDEEEVENLIIIGADVNGKEKQHDNITPLFLAVENGDLKITEMLLNFGAKVNARDKNKQTPLMRIDDDATPELVSLLIKHGAKVNLTDKEKNTTLIFASGSVNAEVLQILLEDEADVDAQNSDGQTALMNAAESGNLEN
ncbi:MAG: ankyrin repeat domain-containing protein, partial [Acidobacteriota bacterium]|nr:ankyrin repeat domain-containing protein [Acidobacteriota bacterium]